MYFTLHLAPFKSSTWPFEWSRDAAVALGEDEIDTPALSGFHSTAF